MKHAAVNVITGDVITTNNGNYLKRLVKRHNNWNRNHGYEVGKWNFYHGENWRDKYFKKMEVK